METRRGCKLSDSYPSVTIPVSIPSMMTPAFAKLVIQPHRCILVQYSDKFMHSIVLYSIVLRRSQLYCIVNLLL